MAISKESRRKKEEPKIRAFLGRLNEPVPPKKPQEFRFSKDDTNSFEPVIAMGNTVIEKKSDGYCTHAIVDKKAAAPVRLFSSGSQEWNPDCFPEIVKGMLMLPNGYYHGEILGASAGSNIEEYSAMQNRPRQNADGVNSALLEKYPLKIDLFDALRINKQPLLLKSLGERKSQLEKIVGSSPSVSMIESWHLMDSVSLREKYAWAIGKSYEGLIAKDPDSFYLPGSRDNDWVKLKEFLTLDLAVLGVYFNEDRALATVLVGSYNDGSGRYETMAKVKIGAADDKEEILRRVRNRLKPFTLESKTIAFNPAVMKIKRKIPDSIVEYSSSKDIVILEVQTQDITYSKNWHSCWLQNGQAHSMRVAFLKQIREDKSRREDVTTSRQVHEY